MREVAVIDEETGALKSSELCPVSHSMQAADICRATEPMCNVPTAFPHKTPMNSGQLACESRLAQIHHMA